MQIVFFDFDNKVRWYEFENNFGFIDDAVSDNFDLFDSIAHECDIASLSQFVGIYVEENPYEIGLGGAWFSVEDGLTSINAIIRYLQRPQEIGKSKATARKARVLEEYIVEEMKKLRDQLASAAQKSRNAKFKLILFEIQQGYPVVATAPKVFPPS